MDIREKDKQYIANTYNRSDKVIVSGNGATCLDSDGNTLIDFGSGIGVNSLGFADKEWVEAVSSQASKLQHISNLYHSEPCVEVAELLVENTCFNKVFFSNSGAEAVECAIKTARKYSFDKYGNDRYNIITLKGSFHGRTMTALTATGQDVFHNFFFPFDSGFRYAEPNNLEQMVAIIDNSVCAIMIEIVQGEGGVNVLDKKYVKSLCNLCRERDILLIVDEVQTGIGRTGTFLASEQYDIVPDITTLAKGLGGGLPIGACLMGDRVENTLGFSHHGTTYGGNPIVCAGVKVVLNRVLNGVTLSEVQIKHDYIINRLDNIEGVSSVTGLGLMIGILHKTKSAQDISRDCMEQGLIVLTAKDKIRLLPPLNISISELEKGMDILVNILNNKEKI